MKARWKTSWLQNAAGCGVLVAMALAFPGLGFANGNVKTIGPSSTLTPPQSPTTVTEIGYSFGHSEASTTLADGTTIVVIGAPDSTATNTTSTTNPAPVVDDAGAAYLYVELPGSGWSTPPTQALFLYAGTPVAGSGFGDSVAISSDGKTVLVGAPSQGEVYVFTEPNGGWAAGNAYSNTILTDGASGDNFGISVGVSNNLGSPSQPDIVAVVGADQAASTDGAAYVFTGSSAGWSTASSAVPIADPGKTPGDLFGDSVAITSDGATILVGSSGATSGAGQAYVFSLSGTSWASDAPLFASGAIGFGTSVAMSGTMTTGLTAVVGAPGNTSGNTLSPGAAYVYTASTATGGWGATPPVELTNGTNGDFLGTSVAISQDGNTIAVGAPDAPSTSSPTPAIYEFDASAHGKNPGSYSGHLKSYEYAISNTGTTDFGDSVAVVTDSTGVAWIFGGTPVIPTVTSGNATGEAFVFTQ